MDATEQRSDEEMDQVKEITVIVNGQQKTVSGKELSFDDLVALAYDGSPPTGEFWEFTITYRRGHGSKPQGSLVDGETVKVKKGMIFDVYGTDKS